MAKRKVLFVCTGNSARSQIAEVLLNHQAGEYFEAFSAGTEPDVVNPKVVSVLSSYGVSGDDLKSKHISVYGDQYFDFIITLCDKARRECKTFENAGKQMAWDFEDPQFRSGVMPFETALKEINNRLAMFISVETKTASKEEFNPVQFYKCLTDEIRLKCLMLVQYEGELCVCELMEALKDSQPKVSRNLAILRENGLLVDRRLGQWVFYRINPDLPEWAKLVISSTAESNVGFIQKSIRNLSQMGERPDRTKNFC